MFRNPVTDVILVIVVLLLFFGPKRLPIIGRELGRGMREFKDGITGDNKDEEQPALNPAATQPDAPVAQPAPVTQAAPQAERAPADTPSEPRS